MSETWYVKVDGTLYNAPLGGQFSDRLATASEIAAWESSLAAAQLANMSVTAFQAQAAMAQAQAKGITTFNLLAQVQSIVNASTDPIVSLAWNKAAVFDRQSPMILGLAAQVPLTSAQLDQLFQLASTITA